MESSLFTNISIDSGQQLSENDITEESRKGDKDTVPCGISTLTPVPKKWSLTNNSPVFDKHLYYPKPINVDGKRRKRTDRVPSAISCQAWRVYHCQRIRKGEKEDRNSGKEEEIETKKWKYYQEKQQKKGRNQSSNWQ